MKILFLIILQMAIWAEDGIVIDATLNALEIPIIINVLKEVDDLPILSFRQNKVDNKEIKIEYPDGSIKYGQKNDANMLIVRTGKSRFLSGGGKVHALN